MSITDSVQYQHIYQQFWHNASWDTQFIPSTQQQSKQNKATPTFDNTIWNMIQNLHWNLSQHDQSYIVLQNLD